MKPFAYSGKRPPIWYLRLSKKENKPTCGFVGWGSTSALSIPRTGNPVDAIDLRLRGPRLVPSIRILLQVLCFIVDLKLSS